MNKIKKINPILITGAERSGSTFIARILDMCGVWSGDCNRMFENNGIPEFKRSYSLFPQTALLTIPVSWHEEILTILQNQNWTGKDWMVKGSFLAQYWPIWYYAFPDAKWLIVRRRTGDVIQSCIKTGYMKTFKNPENLKLICAEQEDEGWVWWVHQYEKKFVEMMEHGLNCRVLWPERMVDGDFSQMRETVEWLGLKWNSKIPEVISPLLDKDRRVKK